MVQHSNYVSEGVENAFKKRKDLERLTINRLLHLDLRKYLKLSRKELDDLLWKREQEIENRR